MARTSADDQDGDVAELTGSVAGTGDALDPLPLYVLEDEREARHRLRQLGTAVRGQWRALATVGTGSTNPWPTMQRQPVVAQMPAMLVVTRVIDLAPQAALAAFDQWWQDDVAPPQLTVGADTLEVVRPHRASPSTSCLLRMRTRLHHGAHWAPPQRLDLEVLSWSAVRTELDLRPVGPFRRTHHFFAVGHDLLRAVATQLFVLSDAAPATPPPSASPP